MGEIVQTDAGEQVSLVTVIREAVRDKDTDVSKMERLFELYEREAARLAQVAFNSSFVACGSAIMPVAKNKRNDQTSSSYSDLSAIADAVDPILAQHGFRPSFGTGKADLEGHYRVTCTLFHEGGHSKDYYADIPVDNVGLKGNVNKTLTHAFGSTMSYGRRYLKLMIFDVATTDDNDGNCERAPSQQDRAAPPSPDPAPQQMSKANAREDYDNIIKEIRSCRSLDEIQEWGRNNIKRVGLQPTDWQTEIRKEYAGELDGFKQAKRFENEASEHFSGEVA